MQIQEKQGKMMLPKVARHANIPNSTHNMTICRISQHQGKTESRKASNFNLALSTLVVESINTSRSTNYLHHVHITIFPPM